jgi:hypothetical protein
MTDSKSNKSPPRREKYSKAEEGAVDYVVQAYFYGGAYISPHASGSNHLDIIQESSGVYSVTELDNIHLEPGLNFCREELDYKPPWISEDLLDYSLRGLDAIKL